MGEARSSSNVFELLTAFWAACCWVGKHKDYVRLVPCVGAFQCLLQFVDLELYTYSSTACAARSSFSGVSAVTNIRAISSVRIRLSKRALRALSSKDALKNALKTISSLTLNPTRGARLFRNFGLVRLSSRKATCDGALNSCLVTPGQFMFAFTTAATVSFGALARPSWSATTATRHNIPLTEAPHSEVDSDDIRKEFVLLGSLLWTLLVWFSFGNGSPFP